MIVIAAAWIFVLLAGGAFALDRVLTNAITRNFDAQLSYALNAMIASAEMGPDGEIRFSRPLGDQRFLEPYSGLYWQVTAKDAEPFRSRSLWDRAIDPAQQGSTNEELYAYDTREFPQEPLRVLQRDVRLPGSERLWRFQVAESRVGLDDQIHVLRSTLGWSFAALGLGLVALAALQATYGLWPLRRVRRAIAAIRSGRMNRVPTDFPPEIEPFVAELNALIEHNESQSEAARRHAGNLAHALKTPMAVLMNEAMARDADLPETVIRETGVMRRQINHHLARARAIGRRATGHARAEIWPSLEAVARAVSRMHSHATVDIAGDKKAAVAGEKQDLEEMLGNLIENAAKYGSGRVFVTVERNGDFVEILIEDDGPGIPESRRAELFGRGARLDTTKPGTGLGLSIVRDVVEIYGGEIILGESEDLGGLAATLRLPAAAQRD
jgi:signal transduction histidine kinase